MININDKKQCTGCTACASVCTKKAISMLPDEEGFLYPSVDKNLCNNCGLCERVCPIKVRQATERSKTYLRLYAVRHKDNDILMNSSSGGAFSALAEFVIGHKGVVYGAIYDNDMKVIHSKAETLDDYKQMRGSKYSQSEMTGVYADCKSELLKGRNVLFTGTPCQIAGLNAYLHKPYENLLTIDLICHAVPSPKIFAEYVNYVNKKYKDNLIDIAMRYKQSYGWSHSFAYRYIFKSGKSLIDPIGLIDWGRIYFSGCIDRPSCSNCQFTNFDRVGDITIADFWDDLFLRPDLKSKKGTSLFMINSMKGIEIARHLNESLDFWDITEYEALQRCLIKPSDVSSQHKQFWAIYRTEGFDGVLKKIFPVKTTALIKKHIKGLIKKFI